MLADVSVGPAQQGAGDAEQIVVVLGDQGVKRRRNATELRGGIGVRRLESGSSE
jgi:hypothetical protein